MPVLRTDIRGSINVGNYAKAMGDHLLLTGDAPDRQAKRFEKTLGGTPVRVRLRDCHLTSPFFAGNSSGILASRFVEDETLEALRNSSNSQRVHTLETRFTAIGNLILANDRGALVSPVLSASHLRVVRDALNAEVEKGTLGRASYVGSLATVNNHGGIVTPFALDEEIQRLEDLLGIEVHRGTINSGIPFIASGLVATDKGALAGKLTDGKELMAITQALKVL